MKVIMVAITGISFIIGLWIVGAAYKYRSTTMETINVTGLAEKDFASDLIVWNGSYSRKSMDLKNAYAALKNDETTIRTYLKDKGIADNEMVFSSININKEFSNKIDETGRQASQEFTGYNLVQSVKIESNNVDKIDKISREVTELINSGIEFNSSPPLYYNTKLSEVKMDLLARASADAKARAEVIAKNAGR